MRAWSRRGALVVIALIAATLNAFRLDQNGFGNSYYAAAVLAMLDNWSAFFFAAFDAPGFVTVDKPPVGLWIQAASAKLFGFSGVSVLAPQAVAGVGSTLLLYAIVRRQAGVAAGLLAALVYAVTPIAVAMNRSNELDGLLVFVLLLGVAALLRATDTGRLRWLLLAVGLVGVGFNIKMLQAYLVLPALYLTYWLGAPGGLGRRTVHLTLASVGLVVVSFAWIVVVDLTPPDRRPYIGSSQRNSALELALGHNGLSRIVGGFGGPGSRLAGVFGGGNPAPAGPNPANVGPPPGQTFPPGSPPAPGFAPGGPPGQPLQPGAFGAPGGPRFSPGPGGGPVLDGGSPGPGRLFGLELAGLISWLIPLATIGLVAAWRGKLSWRFNRRQRAVLLWGGWVVVMAMVFSFATGIFHRYYTVMLAPGLAAAVGIGGVALWRHWRRGGWRRWLAPVAALTTAAWQLELASRFPEWSLWLASAIGGVIVVALVVGFMPLILPLAPATARRWAAAAAGLALIGCLIGPTTWSVVTASTPGNPGIPNAGPSANLVSRSPMPNPGGGQFDRQQLIAYLTAQRDGARYLVATPSAMLAAPMSLATGAPVMALGGFSGGDPIVTSDRLAELVDANVVRFFLVTTGVGAPGGGPASPPGGPRGRFRPLATVEWIQQTCQAAPDALWRGSNRAPAGPPLGPTSPPIGGPGFGGPPGSGRVQLYDCRVRGDG